MSGIVGTRSSAVWDSRNLTMEAAYAAMLMMEIRVFFD
jgi:hypothetical protein